MSTYVGTSWDMETGHPSRSELSRRNYDSIAELLDPEIVFAKLRERFGPRLDKPRRHHSVNTPVRDRLSDLLGEVPGTISSRTGPRHAVWRNPCR